MVGCGWKSGLRDAAGNEAVMKRRIAWQLHELLRLENTYVRGFMTFCFKCSGALEENSD